MAMVQEVRIQMRKESICAEKVIVVAMDDWLYKGGIDQITKYKNNETGFSSVRGVTNMKTCGTVLEMEVLA